VRVALGDDLECVIFRLAAQAASVPAYPASAQTRRTLRQARWVFHSSGRAPWRSWTQAGLGSN